MPSTGSRSPTEAGHAGLQGYRYKPDKFSTAQLTEQVSVLVLAPGVAECPVQLECRVVSARPLGGPEPHATAFEVEGLRAHVEEDLVIPGTHYVDPRSAQVLLLPPSLDDWLSEDRLARFNADLVDEVLDLGPVLADYTEKHGCPPRDPRLMGGR